MVLVAVLVAAGLLVGCDDANQLKAANRSLTMRVEDLESQNQRLTVENENLQGQLTSCNARVDELQGDVDKKEAALKRLHAMYEEALAKRTPGVSIALPPKLNEALQKFASSHPEMIEFDPQYGMVKFKSDLTFPSGSANVNEEAAGMLGKLVEILKTPEAQEFAVYVAGHTDDVPIGKPETKRKHPTNWYLSVHRAVGVQQVLEGAGLDPNRIAVMGFSEYHPVEPNKEGKKGNEKNRRVEIWLVPRGQFLTGEAVQ
jgi:chemotaxis protein MotB